MQHIHIVSPQADMWGRSNTDNIFFSTTKLTFCFNFLENWHLDSHFCAKMFTIFSSICFVHRSMLLSMLSSTELCYRPYSYVIVHFIIHVIVHVMVHVIVHRAMILSMLSFTELCYCPQSYVIHVIVHVLGNE